MSAGQGAAIGRRIRSHIVLVLISTLGTTYRRCRCPVDRLMDFLGQTVILCGLIVVSRVHSQTDGQAMKFLTLADRTGMVEAELFGATYRRFALATVRYPVLEVTATVEPFENGNGYSLRVHRAGQPRKRH